MKENDWLELIHEHQLELLKRKSEWWLIGGIAVIIINIFCLPFFMGAFWLSPFFIIGIIILIEGMLLRFSWTKMIRMKQLKASGYESQRA